MKSIEITPYLKKRTGIKFVYSTNEGGVDTGLTFQNRKSTALNYAFNFWNENGTKLLISDVTGSLDSNEWYINTMSALVPADTGYWIVWDTDAIDDGIEDEFTQWGYLFNGIVSAAIFEGESPIDRRGQNENHSGRQQSLSVNATPYDTGYVFVNPNFPLTGASAIGGSLSGTATTKSTLAAGITGDVWNQGADTHTAVTGNTSFWDNVFYAVGLASSGAYPFMSSGSPHSLAGYNAIWTWNTPNEVNGSWFIITATTMAAKNASRFIED